MSPIEMIPASREFAANGAPRLRAAHTLRNPRALASRGSRALLELRAVIGFLFGLIAFFVGVIALLICWYVYNVRNRRR